MPGRIFLYAEHRIRKTKLAFMLISIAMPILTFVIIRSMNVTFDDVVTLLATILMLVAIFVTYYEGKITINALRKYRIELSSEHLLQVRDRKKDLIFIKEIEGVQVIESSNGKIKRLKIETASCQTSIEGYESMEQLVAYLENTKAIPIRRIK